MLILSWLQTPSSERVGQLTENIEASHSRSLQTPSSERVGQPFDISFIAASIALQTPSSERVGQLVIRF